MTRNPAFRTHMEIDPIGFGPSMNDDGDGGGSFAIGYCSAMRICTVPLGGTSNYFAEEAHKLNMQVGHSAKHYMGQGCRFGIYMRSLNSK